MAGSGDGSKAPAAAAAAPPLPAPAVPTSATNGRSSSCSGVIDFLTLVQSLKTQRRTGWVRHGVEDAESIADHMHRMALMALVTRDIPGVDRDRCVKMAVVHDVAEAIVGDITPSCGISKEEKQRRESEAIDRMCDMLGGNGEEMRQLWEEYEANETAEAKLVKDFDKLEMILQALEYEQAQNVDLEEFFTSTKGRFQTEVGREYALEVVRRRRLRQHNHQ